MIGLDLLAQTTSPESYLLERGILGLAVLVLGTGFLFLARRLVKERDDLAAQRESMIQTLLEVVPLVQRTTTVLESRKILDEQNMALKREMMDTQRAMSQMISDLRRAWEMNQ